MIQAGPTNGILDVAGVRVGHAERRDEGWLTGTTVVLAPAGGAVGGVDVRGGGPGTRETDLLDPRNMVERVHAVVLTGGSAYGLAAADGVMARLEADGAGLQVGPRPGEIVPIVVGAVVFDLGRGGRWTNRPDATMGAAAYDVATAAPQKLRQGVVGAGTGAQAGGLKGGVGSASAILPDGSTVAALVVTNPLGSCLDERGELMALRFGLPGEFPATGPADPGELADLRAAIERLRPAPPRPGSATTIGVVATDATLTKAQCAKVSGVAHDGMARAIRPVHTMFDGDTVFTLATGERGAPDAAAFHDLLGAAGDCFTRAVGHALLAAETTGTASGPCPSYRDALPSALSSVRRTP